MPPWFPMSLPFPPRLALCFALLAGEVVPAQTYSKHARALIGSSLRTIENNIESQRQAGHRAYDPAFVFVVNPAKQRMHVLSRRKGEVVLTVKCGTGKGGLGTGDSQTPPGFFTMGGLRIARNADSSIQTGDTKRGVTGIYAELLFPPSHPDEKLRGRVPNNVVIHSYNPEASPMLKERKEKKLVGRIPCTSGCPVPETDEARKLVPYLQASAGKFDPGARPNAALRTLLSEGKVKQYSRNTLGGGIFIMGGSQGGNNRSRGIP